jgi:hypothetical protein
MWIENAVALEAHEHQSRIALFLEEMFCSILCIVVPVALSASKFRPQDTWGALLDWNICRANINQNIVNGLFLYDLKKI